MADEKDDKLYLSAPARREVLRKLGRFTAVSAPAITLLLAAQAKPASAQPISKCASANQPDNAKPAWSDETNAKV